MKYVYMNLLVVPDKKEVVFDPYKWCSFEAAYSRYKNCTQVWPALLVRYERKPGTKELIWDNFGDECDIITGSTFMHDLIEAGAIYTDERGRLGVDTDIAERMIEKAYFKENLSPKERLERDWKSGRTVIFDDPIVPKAPRYKGIFDLDPVCRDAIFDAIERQHGVHVDEYHYYLDKMVVETKEGVYYYIKNNDEGGWTYRIVYNPEL